MFTFLNSMELTCFLDDDKIAHDNGEGSVLIITK